MKSVIPPSRRGQYMVAMVLGTALTAFAPVANLRAAPSDTSVQSVVADMSRYCTTCWRNARLHPDAWNDCTQEAFSRLLERVTPEAWDRVFEEEGTERREFLRAIDAVKKRTQRSRKWAPSPVETVADPRNGQERVRADERDAVQRA